MEDKMLERAMQKKSQILRRAWDFIIVTTITPLGKVLRKRIAVCCCGGRGGGSKQLILFKRSQRLSLFRHYNYHFIGEYEFSPDNTPLFPRGRWDTPRKRGRLLRLLLCGGAGGGSGTEAIEGGGGGGGELVEESETMSAVATGYDEVEQEPPEESSDWSEDDESVDHRAERFIKRFYEDMRIQRQLSAVEYTQMLDRSC